MASNMTCLRKIWNSLLCFVLSFTIAFVLIDSSNSFAIADKSSINSQNVSLIHGNTDVDRINVIFLSNGYLPSEMQTFQERAKNLTNVMFNSFAFRGYENYFNVYSIECPSEESSEYKSMKSKGNYFFSVNVHPKVDRMLVMSPDSIDPMTVATKLIPSVKRNPEYTFCVILQNSSEWAGSGGPRTILCDNINYYDYVTKSDLMFLHEFAHSYAALDDEYDCEIKNTSKLKNSSNISLSKSAPPWADLIGRTINGVSIDTIPVDKECTYFRASDQCIMRDLGPVKDFCPVCANIITKKTTQMKNQLFDKTNKYKVSASDHYDKILRASSIKYSKIMQAQLNYEESIKSIINRINRNAIER